MSSIVTIGRGGLDMVALNYSCGDAETSAEIYLFGATLCSYKTADGEEQIFVSPAAEFDAQAAIRGGVPIVFPQFDRPDPAMPRHGFARNSMWSLQNVKRTTQAATAILELTDNEETRKVWNHAFRLTYVVTLTLASLKMALHVENTGDAPFDFNCLLHTYLKIPAIEKARVRGLGGRMYRDKAEENEVEPKLESSAEIVLPMQLIDRVYLPLPDEAAEMNLIVKNDEQSQVTVNNEACLNGNPYPLDVVMWNPYHKKSPADLPIPCFRQFLCLEPGLVSSPLKLQPGAKASVIQRIFPASA